MPNRRIDVDMRAEKIRMQVQVGDPAVPSAGYNWLYVKALGLYLEQDDATVLGPFGAGGGGADILEVQVFS